MNNLYNKIYESIDTGIQKALIIPDDQSNDVSVKWDELKKTTEFTPYKYKTVDLDLPSGLLWAEYNLGAFPGNNPKDWYGDYYAWGETDTKLKYYVDTYKFHKCNNDSTVLLKYNNAARLGSVDNKLILELNDDVAYKMLYDKFRMPTKDDCYELINNTTHQCVHNYKNIMA